MNKVFKIVFNAARGTRMVVNETTSSVQSGKKAAVTVAVVGALASGVATAATTYGLDWQNNGTAGQTISYDQKQVVTLESDTDRLEGVAVNLKTVDFTKGVNVSVSTSATQDAYALFTKSDVEGHASKIILGAESEVYASSEREAYTVVSSGIASEIQFNANTTLTVNSESGFASGLWAQYNGSIKGSADLLIKVDGAEAWGITSYYNHGGHGSVDLSGDITVNVTSTNGSAYGVFANNSSSVSLTGDVNFTVTANDPNGDTTGVFADVNVGQGTDAKTTITLGSESTEAVIKVSNTAHDAQGIWARKDPGTQNSMRPQIDVNAKKLDLTVSGARDVIGVWAASKTSVGTDEANQSMVNLNSADTIIRVSSTNGEAHGIVAHSQGIVNATSGNVYVTADGATLSAAISGRGNSTINVGKAGYVTQLNGDIVFDYDVTGGSDLNSDITVLLDGENSHLKGNIYADNGTNASVVDLTISNNAIWYANRGETTNDSNVDKLTLNGGVVDIQGGTTVTVDSELAGSGTIALGSDADKFVFAGEAEDNTLTSVNVTQAGATADTMTAADAEAAAALYADNVVDKTGEALKTTFVVAEGEVGGEIVVGADGTAEQAVNAKTEALADKVWLAPNMITRIMMNDVRKRMGDLRAAEGTHGVWARYNGGQMSGSGVDADFSMVQVGIDTVPVVDAPRFGVAFSYAETESKDNLGTTDMDSFSLAFYGTKMYDNGMFVDVIGRMATMDSDIANAGAKGKMDNVALSLSGELGWRFDVTDRFFFEPSVEATYTYTNADTFTMTNGGTYELEAMDSLVGRAGFAAGFKCPANKGDVYVRAAVVHEFMGDATINSWTANGAATPIESDGKDTWFEYAIGAQFNVNKNTYVYADIERTEGATMDEDWRANVGVRFAF